MATSDQNVTMYSGDSRVLAFTITEANGTTPINLTGAVVAWACARKLSGGFSTTPTLSKEIGAGITIIAAIAGTLEVALAPADTASLVGRYYHELQVTDAAGNVSTVATGTLTITKDLIVD
jgi:hypothetical protein